MRLGQADIGRREGRIDADGFRKALLGLLEVREPARSQYSAALQNGSQASSFSVPRADGIPALATTLEFSARATWAAISSWTAKISRGVWSKRIDQTWLPRLGIDELRGDP